MKKLMLASMIVLAFTHAGLRTAEDERTGTNGKAGY